MGRPYKTPQTREQDDVTYLFYAKPEKEVMRRIKEKIASDEDKLMVAVYKSHGGFFDRLGVAAGW